MPAIVIKRHNCLSRVSHCNWPAGQKAQVNAGNVSCSVSRTDQEKAKTETLEIGNLIAGSEVRLVTSGNEEFVQGVESSDVSLTLSYKVPLEPLVLTLSIINPGYYVASQLYVTGLGNRTIQIFQKVNEAYQNG